jgi:predicted dehydrogenase
MEGDWLDYYDATVAGSPHGGRRGFTRIETIARYGPPGDFPAPRAPIGWIRAHMHCLYCFLRSIAEDQPAAPGLLDGVRVQQIMDAAYRSAENGQWVRL